MQDINDRVTSPATSRYACDQSSVIFVDDVESADLPSVYEIVFYEVIAPDMVPMFWSHADTGTITEPQPSSFQLLAGHLKSALPPDTLDTFVVHASAFFMEHRRYTAVSISAIVSSKFYDLLGKLIFIIAS